MKKIIKLTKDEVIPFWVPPKEMIVPIPSPQAVKVVRLEDINRIAYSELAGWVLLPACQQAVNQFSEQLRSLAIPASPESALALHNKLENLRYAYGKLLLKIHEWKKEIGEIKESVLKGDYCQKDFNVLLEDIIAAIG